MNFDRTHIRVWIHRLSRDEGQTLVEYGLILAFISITAFSLTPVGTWAAARLAEVAAAL